MKELVVISGKGGTGKTSVSADFAALTDRAVVADVDVDAPDMHLILQPEIKERHAFAGGGKAWIDEEQCIACGKCMELCHFEAVSATPEGGYRVDDLACEGCGLCVLVCPADAVSLREAENGEWYVSESRFGKFVHARLGAAQENSGKLVTVVRNHAHQIARREKAAYVICDGAPGIGCPVTASLAGADLALVVTEPTPSGLHDMERVLELTMHFGVPSGVVVNKWDLNASLSDEIERRAAAKRARSLGRIDYDDVFTAAQKQELTIEEYSPASKAAAQVRDLQQAVMSALDRL